MSPMKEKVVHLYHGHDVSDWTGVTKLVVEERPDDGMKKIIHEALDKHKVPVVSANAEVQFYIDSFLTGANL